MSQRELLFTDNALFRLWIATSETFRFVLLVKCKGCVCAVVHPDIQVLKTPHERNSQPIRSSCWDVCIRSTFASSVQSGCICSMKEHVSDKCVSKDNNVMPLWAPSRKMKSCQGSVISYRPDPWRSVASKILKMFFLLFASQPKHLWQQHFWCKLQCNASETSFTATEINIQLNLESDVVQ